MSEQALRLSHGVTYIDDALIEEAQTVKPQKAIRPWLKWGAAAACVALALLLTLPRLGGKAARSAAEELTGSGELAPDGGGEENSVGCYGFPGGILPVLRVGDALYRWTNMSMPTYLDPSGALTIDGSASTFLPDGFSEYGEISGVTTEAPEEELQLQAGFPASGTVFAGAQHPAVVYVRMTTDWFEEQYVRFVSDALGENEQIAWQGKLYRIAAGRGELTPAIDALPEGAEQIGALRFVGVDSIPQQNLETNCRSDGYARPIDGREVWAVPGEDRALYVREHYYWAQGEGDRWLVCGRWDLISWDGAFGGEIDETTAEKHYLTGVVTDIVPAGVFIEPIGESAGWGWSGKVNIASQFAGKPVMAEFPEDLAVGDIIRVGYYPDYSNAEALHVVPDWLFHAFSIEVIETGEP